MKQLILKDIKNFGAYNIVSIILSIGLGYIGASYPNKVQSNFIYSIPILISSFVFTLILVFEEANSNSQPLFASMPVSKFDIVKSRYISILLYIAFTLGIVFLTSNISVALFDNIYGSTLTLNPMMFISAIILLALSISLPVQYYNIKTSQTFIILFIIVLGILPTILDNLGLGNFSEVTVQKIMSLNYDLISPLLLIGSLVIYSISLFISKNIYERKEF